MKQVIFSVMITCWATFGVAQQFHAGMGVGFRKTSAGSLTIAGTTLEITNPRDEKYLVPGMAFRKPLGRKWFLEAYLQYQPGGLSLQVYDPPRPGCVLCPVRKGTLVSYRELLTSLSAGYTFIQAYPWSLDFSVGLMPAVRFGIRQSGSEGLQHLSTQALALLAGGEELVKRAYWNGRVKIGLHWKKWTLSYQYGFLLDRSSANAIRFDNQAYELALDQKLQIAGIAFCWARF